MSKRFFLILLLIFAVNIAHAEQEIYFTNVLPGGYAEKTIELNSTPVNITVEGQDWVKADVQDLNLKIIVSPPDSSVPGNYTSSIKINYYVIDKPMTTSVQQTAKIPVFIGITTDRVEQARVAELEVMDSDEKSPIRVTMSIENNGNLPIEPEIGLVIFSMNSQEILNYSLKVPSINATQTWEGLVAIPHNLSKGRYLANLTLSSNGVLLRRQLSEFNIVDKLPEAETNKTLNDPPAVPLSTSFFLLVWAIIAIVIIWSFAKRISRIRN